MLVNSFNRLLKSPQSKLFAIILAVCCSIFFLASFISNKSSSESLNKRVNIAMRAIGHDLLLRAGDSLSVVPPVIEKSKGVFVLEFKNEFVFQPDTLAEVVQRVFAKTDLAWYTVTVQKCNNPDIIVYGFEINPPNNSIQSCRGRTQPKACYIIEIAFSDFPSPAVLNSKVATITSGILLMLAVALFSFNRGTKRINLAVVQNTSDVMNPVLTTTIGKFEFDTLHKRLSIGKETIALTDKESRILTLLNKNIEQLTPREELIQDVWTDDGVITGRSLDMFISKLRKKLSADPDLRITNIHGKGYKLEIVKDGEF